MKFKSKSQERFFFSAHKDKLTPGTAKEGVAETPDIKALPDHVPQRYGRGFKPKTPKAPKMGGYRSKL